MKAQTMTIAQAEQAKGSSVWAMNGSGGRGQQKGIINITITEGNGQRNVVRLPVTFIPVDLTTQATKNAILSSPDFRRLVQRGFVKLVSEEDAAKMLDSDEARKEQQRVLELDSAELEEIQTNAPEDVKAMLAESSGQIGGYAMNLAHTEVGQGDEDQMVSNLRNNADSLSRDELQYIANNSKFPRVKTLAADLIVNP